MIPELFHSLCIQSLLDACTHFDSSRLSPNTNYSSLSQGINSGAQWFLFEFLQHNTKQFE